jgi:ABC-type branched-subunit amino acid transport system ATPase component/branched-subunit amino acid ABC-type transport system permease component
MLDIVRFAILGASAGSVLALLGLGVNVVYRASRVMNFSHAAIAVTAAYAYKNFTDSVPWPLAIVGALVVGLLIGALTDVLVMRPLRNASTLTKAIATIGILLVLQAGLNIRYGYNPLIVEPWLPGNIVNIGGVVVGADNIATFFIGLAVTALLYLVFRRSSLGLASTALSVSPRSLAALGKWSPGTVSLINWMIAGVLAAFAGVLLAPVTSLAPTLTLTLVVPVLSVALLGRLSSFWLTFAGGIFIGVAQSEIGLATTLPGAQDAIPFLVIVVILAIRGTSLPARGESAERLPKIGSGRIPVIPAATATVIAFALVQWILPIAWVSAVTVGLLAAVVVLSLVVVTGYAGQLNLASYGLAGVAALVAALLVAHLHWSFLVAGIVGVLATVPVGLLVGLPAVRTRGTSLAVVTLGLAVVFQSMIFDSVPISNGTTGLAVGDPKIFGLDISAIFYPRRYAVFALVIFVAVAVCVLNLRRSAAGRRMLAVRGNEAAAASIGVSVARTKLYAFVVAAVIAGVGGVLIAFTNINVVMGDPGGRFDPTYSINAISEATVGGIGYVSGPLVGTLVEPGAVMNQVMLFITSGSWLNLIGGVLLLITVVTAPSGIAANVQQSIRQLTARLPRRARAGAAAVPGLSEVLVTRVPPAELAVRGLSIGFGGNQVLHSVDLDIRPGRVLGVIGPNGAGKTTLVEAITGYNRPQAGTVTLDGRSVTSLPPASRARAGIARSFQALELFEDLSVLDNLLVASDQVRWYSTLLAGLYPGRPRLGGAAAAAVATFGLADRLHDSPGDLSYGARRLLAIARALATRPRVLLLDEPAAGLGGREREDLRKLVRVIAEDWGIAVLIIEHDVELVLGVSDEIVALDFGRVIARGAPAEVRNDPAVIAAYLGTDDPAPDDSAADSAVDSACEEQSA